VISRRTFLKNAVLGACAFLGILSRRAEAEDNVTKGRNGLYGKPFKYNFRDITVISNSATGDISVARYGQDIYSRLSDEAGIYTYNYFGSYVTETEEQVIVSALGVTVYEHKNKDNWIEIKNETSTLVTFNRR
jgi:hypothetical protein